ncbi:Uracil permease [Geobacillus sp. BCO2]|nr:Uracil permease [Geobacillus sp. BCO2]
MNKPVLDIQDRPTVGQWVTLSLQHLFAMFGATILVPYLVGLDPSIALLTSGLGTLAFLLITKWQVPAYLAPRLPTSRRSSRRKRPAARERR